ncbi:sulfurtransferase [Nocardia bovistercoris]|uniref:thiosulfate sulfurtransferase n=1 Tax=Nocardia bovistercoris TaxID=2785916 RepID=A0A931IDT6_9NOCA|nr:rhodanese-like domain-containing protein [Nocardia bovistercoris]MBH0779351.1 sulfurtransferase [Nocardia bovistercoris]
MTSTPVHVDRVTISAERLRKKIANGRDVVVLEVRRTPQTDDAAAQRIPGAHAVTVADFAGPETETSGTFPLPSAEQIQASIRHWGITADSIVVTYSPDNAAAAARAWWTLRWAGVPDVRYLDGGVEAWTAAGGALTDEPATEGASDFVVTTGALPTLDADTAAALARSGVLVDTRGAEGYAEAHIPGAGYLPGTANLTDDGHLADDETLRARYRELGVEADTEVGLYCVVGNAAALSVLALTKIGVPAHYYPGSLSEYRTDPTRPIATGLERG